MRPTAVFVRFLPPEERQPMAIGLRSSDACLVRRCPSVLASAYGAGVPRRARQVGCSDHPVRKGGPAFPAQGVAGPPRGGAGAPPPPARLPPPPPGPRAPPPAAPRPSPRRAPLLRALPPP